MNNDKLLNNNENTGDKNDNKGHGSGGHRGSRSRRREEKSQAFSIDLIVSLGLFAFVLLAAGFLLARVQAGIDSAAEKNVLTTLTESTFNSLALSPGQPLDWTNSSVSSIGLANPDKSINCTKLLELMYLDYDAMHSLLGLGKYNARLFFTENGSLAHSGIARQPIAYFASDDYDLFAVLNGTHLTWDFYWGSGALPEPPHGDARNFYGGPKNVVFQWLLENQSAYQTIIIEDPVFAPDVLVAVNISLLYDFLNARGLLVFEGNPGPMPATATPPPGGGGESGGNPSPTPAPQQPLVVNVFNESFVAAGDAQVGVVSKTRCFLHNTSTGEPALFNSSYWLVYRNESAGDFPLTIFVSKASLPELGLVASWDWGLGKIYFIEDYDSVFGSEATPGASVYNTVGWLLDYGLRVPANASDVSIISRPVLVQRDWGALASMNLVVWSEKWVS